MPFFVMLNYLGLCIIKSRITKRMGSITEACRLGQILVLCIVRRCIESSSGCKFSLEVSDVA